MALTKAKREKEKAVLNCFLENLECGDKAIAKIMGTDVDTIRRVRTKFNLPTARTKSDIDDSCDTPEEKQFRKEDDIDLEKGVCKINLRGDYYARYMDIYNRKRFR